MLEGVGNLWTYPADARVITTNGFVKKNGEAVMGRGCAREAALKWPELPKYLGQAIKIYGNHVFAFDRGIKGEVPIITMPVKHNWWESADPKLIKRSAEELQFEIHEWKFNSVVMPRPGCGNGQLKWEQVKFLLNTILDDRFVVITWA